jgi:hypothetical protein
MAVGSVKRRGSIRNNFAVSNVTGGPNGAVFNLANESAAAAVTV